MKLVTTINVIALGTAITFNAFAGEMELSWDKLPANVRTAMQEVAASGKITRTTRETEKDGRVIYEVAYGVGERKFEAEISSQGKVLVVDEQIMLSAAPASVRKAIEEATAGGKIKKIEKATEDKRVFYEAEFTRSGKEHEVKVDPNGKILAVE